MRKATAIYHAPEGDNKVCEMGGVTFFDGKETELNSDEHAHLMSKLQTNPHFEIEVGEEEQDDKPRRGRPPKNRDFKAGIDEASDHDFEADRRAAIDAKQPKAQPEKVEEKPVGTSPKPAEPVKEPAS